MAKGKGRGGARPNSGPKPKPILTGGKEKFQEIIDALNRPESPKDSEEIKTFRAIKNSGADHCLALMKWLYDQALGMPIRTVNHLHDKPIEHTHTFQLSLEIKEARERAAKK